MSYSFLVFLQYPMMDQEKVFDTKYEFLFTIYIYIYIYIYVCVCVF